MSPTTNVALVDPALARRISRLVPAMLLAAMSAASPATADAQQTLSGYVRDADGVPLSGATIEIAGTRSSVTSDASGGFRIQRAPAGRLIVQARRIGFKPAETSIQMPSDGEATLEVVMERTVPVLDPVLVEGLRARQNLRLAAFYERRDKGLGHFFTREDIDRRSPMRTTDLLRSLPGVRQRTIDNARSVLYFRGSSCPPMVYIDGSPMAAGWFDPDLITVGSIEGIEVYSGPSTVPPQFTESRQMGSCGVIVIWSRTEIPPPRRRTNAENARALAELVERSRIFTADQVDSIAIIADSLAATPMYPERLLHERTSGRVIAEFVVDTTGRVERETLGLVSSTHREFADAVMVALTRALFRPAIRNGQRVRQLVQQPFNFDAGNQPPVPLRTP